MTNRQHPSPHHPAVLLPVTGSALKRATLVCRPGRYGPAPALVSHFVRGRKDGAAQRGGAAVFSQTGSGFCFYLGVGA